MSKKYKSVHETQVYIHGKHIDSELQS